MRKSSRSLIGAAAVALLVAAATPVACGSDTDSKPSTGGADGGGSGGTGGIAPGGGGTPGGGVGGKSGSGGTGATDAGIDWGADPKWESTGQVAAGCPIERLANPKEMKAFVWKTCSWAADCEEAVFNPKLLGADAALNPTSNVHDDGAEVRIGLSLESSKHSAVFASGDGTTLDGIRGSLAPGLCHFWSASIWGSRFAVSVSPLSDGGSIGTRGGVLVDVGANPVNAFTLSSVPPGGPQRYPLGEKRWLWWWAPVDRFSTVSAVDGSDFVIFAKATSLPVVGYAQPIAAGAYFFFEEFEALDGGAVQRKVAYSDGVGPPKPYVVAANPDDDFGSPAYANSHMAFLKGIGRIGISTFKSVEIWTSPYSGQPSSVTPTLFGAFPVAAMARIAGGHGKIASPTVELPGGDLKIEVWDLVTKASVAHVLPKDRVYKAILGISREHVYVAAAKPNAGPSAYLVRYPVP